MQKIVLGGGCFWCVEAIFQRVQGVESATSAYTGGKRPNPTYEHICTGVSGHAEVVEIIYNENIISLSEILEIFFATHNPTTLNQQGADKGTQYRSVVYYDSNKEKEIIEKSIQKAQKNYKDTIVTEVSKLEEVYKAEEYHQNYYNQNTHQGYCQVVISPKIEKFLKNFQSKQKQQKESF